MKRARARLSMKEVLVIVAAMLLTAGGQPSLAALGECFDFQDMASSQTFIREHIIRKYSFDMVTVAASLGARIIEMPQPAGDPIHYLQIKTHDPASSALENVVTVSFAVPMRRVNIRLADQPYFPPNPPYRYVAPPNIVAEFLDSLNHHGGLHKLDGSVIRFAFGEPMVGDDGFAYASDVSQVKIWVELGLGSVLIKDICVIP